MPQDFAVPVAEHDEVLDEVQEPAPVEYALEKDLQLRRALRRQLLAGHGPPRHEPLGSAVSEPMRAVMPSEATRTPLVRKSDPTCAL
jgi:hypothetical protein